MRWENALLFDVITDFEGYWRRIKNFKAADGGKGIIIATDELRVFCFITPQMQAGIGGHRNAFACAGSYELGVWQWMYRKTGGGISFV